jgi:hypothetical protein
MNDFFDTLLKLPRRIDFIHYTPFAGGDFFTTMIINSHEKTKNIVVGFAAAGNPAFKDDEKTYENGFQIRKNHTGNVIFGKPTYKNLSYLAPISKIVHHLTIEQTIDLYKCSLLNSILPSFPNPPPGTGNDISLHKDTIVIIADHWVMNTKKMEEFSKCQYWNMLNIDPETKFATELMYKIRDATSYNLRRGLTPEASEFQKKFLDRHPNIERFPFLDYILVSDYKGIMDWIENRYGSDLDFDFIDRSLKMWKTVRVEPYLNDR